MQYRTSIPLCRPRAGLLFLASALVTVNTVGCGDDTSSSSGTTGGTTGGSGGMGGAGGAGGDTGGSGGDFPIGDPIDAPDDTWTFVEFPDTTCMNGSPAGIGINPSSTSDDVVIFLMGGNACFNAVSCSVTANPDGYGAAKFGSESALNGEVFDRSDANNIFQNDSYVFVPYCSGDLHGGRNPSGNAGGQDRMFTGHANMESFLSRLVPTFPDATRVTLIGVSAGGFGAMLNYDQVARAFDGTPVHMVDDSGPFFSSAYATGCLIDRFFETWGVAAGAPSGCDGCTAPDTALVNYAQYLFDTYPQGTFGLISSQEDSTIRLFLGFGNSNCSMIDSQIPPSYAGSKYADGLVDYRDNTIGARTNAKTYYVSGSQHVFMGEASTTSVSGVNLRDWMRGQIEGGTWDDVAP